MIEPNMVTDDDKRAGHTVAEQIAVALIRGHNFLRAAKAEASTDDMLSGYTDDLGTLIESLLRGGHRLSKSDFRRDMKGQIRDYAREGFRIAWEEGGGDVAEAKPDELSKIQDWTKEQQSHVNDFADWLTNKDSDLDAVPDRVALWAAAYESYLNDIKTAAMGDQVGEWKYGDTEHCDTCLELNGQRHRVSWFKDQNYYPQKPGADMDCGGYRCQCEVVNPKTGERIL